jgi:hypothetical protein
MDATPSARDGVRAAEEESALYEMAILAESACERLEMCALFAGRIRAIPRWRIVLRAVLCAEATEQ